MIDVKEYKARGYFIAEINGSTCPDIKSFLSEIGIAFKFPDYYGMNMNAFWECINDLDWLEEKDYVLLITQYEKFLQKEDVETKEGIFKSLLKVQKHWKNVPNYEGEEEFRSRADFIIEIKLSDNVSKSYIVS